MSILIKGMKMPKNCLTCKLRGDGSDSKYIWDCPFTGFEYTREEGKQEDLMIVRLLKFLLHMAI